MNPDLEIREALPKDSEGLERCMVSAYLGYGPRMGGKALPPMEVDYLSEIQNYPTWVVESNGCILGGLIMVFTEQEASIANIAVDPKSQGKGIGGELMRFADFQAKAKGFSELQLATHGLLTENISLYQHLGWVITGRDESRVYMKKML